VHVEGEQIVSRRSKGQSAQGNNNNNNDDDINNALMCILDCMYTTGHGQWVLDNILYQISTCIDSTETNATIDKKNLTA